MTTEFYFEPVSITGGMTAQGEVSISDVTWRGQRYPIVALGRQWTEEDGRHVLVEAVGGARFELQLHREELTWYVRRVWRTAAAA
jgi:hypothetical protein